jgi:pSer/pThr/pTyr-binding forkhead associated (FHA) protein
MDDHRPADEADGLRAPEPSAADGCPPLRLVLRPGGPVVELSRPDVLVGRHSEADVRLPLPDVSRRHCRLLFRDGAWHVLDLKSLNGVFVNDEPVANAVLRHGDTLRVGGFLFAVELPPALVETPPDGLLHRISRALPPGEPPLRKAS